MGEMGQTHGSICTWTHEKGRGKEGRRDGKSLRLSESFCKANVGSSSQNSSQRSPLSHRNGPPMVCCLWLETDRGKHGLGGNAVSYLEHSSWGHQPIVPFTGASLRGTSSWLPTFSPQGFGEQLLPGSQGPLFLRKSQVSGMNLSPHDSC